MSNGIITHNFDEKFIFKAFQNSIITKVTKTFLCLSPNYERYGDMDTTILEYNKTKIDSSKKV